MVHFELDLLGGFRLIASGSELRLPTRKAEALLAYLALPPGKAHARESLSALLWGERGEAQARHSLSQTLFSIRQATSEAGAPPLIVIDSRGVTVDPGRVGVDADRLERLVAESTPEALEKAAGLYKGDLLAGIGLREAAFEEWLTGERSRLRELALGAFGRLLEQHAAAGRTDAAVQVALRLVALDPLQEEVHRQLMRLYVAQGRPASALKQYERCVRTLRQELGVEPEAATVELHAEIKRTRAAATGRATFDLPADRSLPLRPAADAPPSAAGEPDAGLVAALRASEDPSAALAKARTAIRAVGREAELGYLRQRLDEALAGTRRIVFVTGEAGLGKTTLVEAFLDEIESSAGALRIGQGQCLEHRGPGEAYMPVLEALGRLCRAARGGRELIALLADQAPSWLAQMPGVLDAGALEDLERRTRGVTRERMLREMVEAIETMTAERPLVLVLEDLHWSDPSTVDLLARLVRRREPARLLVIGTYRPTDVPANGQSLHATVQELCMRGHCEALALSFLSQTAVEDYLKARFPGATFPAELAGLVHQRTDGNPLFITVLADSWIADGLLVRTDGGWSLWAGPEELTAGMPESLRQLIGQQLDQLGPEDREVLEAASVAGREFSAAAVAATLDRGEEQTEARCAALARQGRFLQPRGSAEWPDGTIASRYSFIHDLYQEVLYDGVPAGRRARLHGRCGARLEAGYSSRARERAGELAVHFLRGRDFERAVRYLQLAAEQSFQRSAQPEALAHLNGALEALRHLPDGDRRVNWELALQTRLGEILTATEGWSSAGAERAFLRARALCRQTAAKPPELSRVLYGLANLYEFRGEFATSGTLIEQRLRLSADADDASFLQAQELLACSLYHRGRFQPALDEAARGLARYGPERSGDSMIAGEMAVHLQAWAAMALWFLGHPDQALTQALEVAELGRLLGVPSAVAGAWAKGAVVHQLRRDAAMTEAWASAALEISTEQGFRYRAATASVLRGWALAARGDPENGIALLRDGLAACRDTGAEMDRPHYLALLAEACGHGDRIGEGLDAVGEGLEIVQKARGGQPFFYEAELHRLKGVLLLREGRSEAEAEASLRCALEVACRQESRSLELRAALDLVRLGAAAGARERLREVYAGFTEGYETSDLIEAKDLLDGRA
jgi:DNA-binding SARP family transcriptional activator/type II secretory pathway predicted ATPase ExeA